jgi:hypothetical protein
MNCDKWEGRTPPDYTARDIPSIRKILTHNWVTFVDNKEDWKAILKM